MEKKRPKQQLPLEAFKDDEEREADKLADEWIKQQGKSWD
jgi:hypothetical protein